MIYNKITAVLIFILLLSCNKENTNTTPPGIQSNFSATINGVAFPEEGLNLAISVYDASSIITVLGIGLSNQNAGAQSLKQIDLVCYAKSINRIQSGNEFTGDPILDSSIFYFTACSYTVSQSGNVMVAQSDSNAYVRITNFDLTGKKVSGEFHFVAQDGGTLFNVQNGKFKDVSFN